LSGFVSEILVFFGAFRAFPLQTLLSVLGIILAAGYILWMLERSLFGPSRERFATITDASPLEAIPLVLLVVSIVVVGVYPAILTEVFETAIEPMVEMINSASIGPVGTR
jgi:NADH-quinone oxidoreductase subunit M